MLKFEQGLCLRGNRQVCYMQPPTSPKPLLTFFGRRESDSGMQRDNLPIVQTFTG